MKKALKFLLIGLLATLVVVGALLPVAVPPVVERLAVQKIAEYGLRALVKMDLGWCWRNGPGLQGSIRLAFAESPWNVRATFGASCGEWEADVRMRETAFDESDRTIATLLEKYPAPSVSNLVFSGSLSFEAHAERTFGKPVPVWSAKAQVRNLSARATVDEKNFTLDGLSLASGASGIADHLDISPIFLRAKSLEADGFALTGLTAAIRPTEKYLLVTEASAGICGGKVSLFSLFLDPATLNTGFTLFVDDVDTGQVLSHFKGFRGDASGKLHGKVRLFVREGGKALRLNDAFLYSTPGEVGKLQMQDATPVTDNLALAGIDDATRANVANALTDLDYSVLKLNLRRISGKDATLSVNLNGTATRDDLSVPVNFTLNFNGELEQIINTGLKLTSQP